MSNTENTGPRDALLYNSSHESHRPTILSPERPDRITRPMQYLKNRVGIFNDDCDLLDEFRQASMEDIARVHSSEYIQFVKNYCKRGGGFLGDSTYFTPGTFQQATIAAGGAIKAGSLVVKGTYLRTFALIRPPGHHAGKDRYGGYCIFNNGAILARHLQVVHKLSRIMMVDWDGHSGNGTSEIFYKDPTVMTISLHRDPKDFYPHDGFLHQIGSGSGRGYNVNIEMPEGSGDNEYNQAFEEIILPLADIFKPDFLIGVNGFDAHHSDEQTGLELSYDGYYDIIMNMKKISKRFPIVMEGGYSDFNGKLMHVVLNAMIGKAQPYKQDNIDKLRSHVIGGYKSHTKMAQNLAKLKLILSEYHPGFI